MSQLVTDVAVVGAGPAGMAAAAAAAFAGCAVTVVDSYAAPGGQYLRQRRTAAPTAAPDRRFARLVDAGRIHVLPQTTVWTAAHEPGQLRPFRLQLTDAGGGDGDATPTDPLRARVLVVATGAIDRVLPFPGWDLPGVLTAGGAQALLKGHGVLPGRRVVVGGSGPFLLPVAAALAAAGSEVVEVCEAGGMTGALRYTPSAWSARDKLREAAGAVATLARHRVRFARRRAVVRAVGDGRVEEVTLADLDADWTPRAGTHRSVAVDAACVSFGFVGQIGLPALLGCRLAPDPAWGDHAVVVDADQCTDVPGLLAAGESTGVAGAVAAAAEGTVAGLAAAQLLGRLSAGEVTELSRTSRQRRDREHRLARALAATYPTRPGWTGWLEDDTIVCRCEEVSLATIRRAVTDLAARDLRSVKLTTRCGMGRCQGRMCGQAVAGIVHELTGAAAADTAALSTPTILEPVTLARIAAMEPDDR